MENQRNNLGAQPPLRASGIAASMLVVSPPSAEGPESAEDASRLKNLAKNEARRWRPSNEKASHKTLERKWSEASDLINTALDQSRELTGKEDSAMLDRSDLRANARLLEAAIADTRELPAAARQLPEVEVRDNQAITRAYAGVVAYLRAVDWKFREDAFVTFISSIQESHLLRIRELWVLKPLTQLVLLEEIGRLLAAQRSAEGCEDAENSHSLESTLLFSPDELQPEPIKMLGVIPLLDKEGPGVVDRYGLHAPPSSPPPAEEGSCSKSRFACARGRGLEGDSRAPR